MIIVVLVGIVTTARSVAGSDAGVRREHRASGSTSNEEALRRLESAVNRVNEDYGASTTTRSERRFTENTQPSYSDVTTAIRTRSSRYTESKKSRGNVEVGD